MHPQFEELKLSGSLPSPSGVGMAILRLTQNDNFTADELAHTIQSDPALTGRIVKMANSAQMAGVKSITSVQEAVVRLGQRTVRNIALGFSLVSGYRDGRCDAFNYKTYWSQSLARAIAAQALSRQLKILVPAEAYICGLLSGIGRLTLASVHSESYSDLLTRLGPDCTSTQLATAELEVFAIHHGDVAACLLKDWQLPDSHCEAMATFWSRAHDAVEANPTTTRLRMLMWMSKNFADVLLADADEAHYAFTRLLEDNPFEALDQATLIRIGDEVTAEWQEWGAVLSVPTQAVDSFADLSERSAADPRPAPKSDLLDDARLVDVDSEDDDLSRSSDGHEDALGQLTVLAVDDDSLSLRLLVTHLKKAGHNVLQAKNGDEALHVALENNPHLVVTDWMMPGLDGIGLVKSLRKTEMGRDMYILILTGAEEETRVVEAFEAGVDDFVKKPFSPPILVSRVNAGDRLVRLRDEMARDKKRLRQQMAELAVLNRKLSTSAVTDPLTQLPNRRYAMARLEEAWVKHRAPGEVSLIMIDIDHFKSVNDKYGHDAGDAVLKDVANAMKSKLRDSDTVCRLGGEEFVVICPGCNSEAAARVAERLRAAVESTRTTFGTYDQSVTISAGVAQRTGDMTAPDALLKAADVAVYSAKHSGRNRVILAEAVAAG